MKETLKSLFLSDWTPGEKGLLLADVLLLGVVIGWLTAPLRHVFTLSGSHSANVGANDRDDYSEDDKEMEEEDEE